MSMYRTVRLSTLGLVVGFVSASLPLRAQGVAEPGVKHQGRLKTPPGTAEDEKEAITRYVAAQDGGVAAIGPRLITYQGLVENAGGPIDNQSMVVEFRAWNALEGGNPRAVAVSKTLSASQLRRGVFSVEMDADQLALPDNADDTYLEVAVCSPAPCSPVALTPRQHLTAAALAVSARSLGGAARAEADGSLVVESSAAASGVMSLKSLGATEAMSLSAAERSLSVFPASGTGSLALRAMSLNGDSTEAFLDDALGELSISKVTLAADETTAVLTAKKLLFKPADGSVAAFRASVAAPLKLASRSPTGETNMVLDDAFGRVSISRVEAAANTAGITPPPKLVLDPREGTIAAAVDSGSATMTLMSTSVGGNTTQLLLDDAVGKVTISKEVAALNTAAASSKKLVIDAANGSVAAFDGANAAAVRFKTGNTLAMEIDPTTNTVTALGAGGFKAGKILIDAGVASNTAGPSPVVEFVTAPGQLELKVDGEVVDRWTGLGAAGGFGLSTNRIGGAEENSVTGGAFGAVISGGGTSINPNQVTAHFGAIHGGRGNRADAQYATVVGGQSNIAAGHESVIGGGADNSTMGYRSTIGGGSHNNSTGWWSTVGGGFENDPSGDYSTVGGGENNDPSGSHATVGGGNTNFANGGWSVIGGGQSNGTSGAYSVVSGGQGNSTFGAHSVVVGGQGNYTYNLAPWSSVGGGFENNCTFGDYATVPGGFRNVADGDYNFAAGRQAKVHSSHPGSFVWADSTAGDFNSTGSDRFLVRASGGTTIYSAADLTAGVTLAAGGGSWSSVSDRNLKENFAEVDTRAVLDRLAETPITTWNYKSQDDSIRHMGPMGQDFHAAFGVGDDEKFITTIDADGVALAAIQGLYEIVQDKDCRIDELEGDKTGLEVRVAALEAMMSKVLAAQSGGRQ